MRPASPLVPLLMVLVLGAPGLALPACSASDSSGAVGTFPTSGVAAGRYICPPDGDFEGTIEDLLSEPSFGLLYGTIVAIEPSLYPVYSHSRPGGAMEESLTCTDIGTAALHFRLSGARASWGEIPDEVEFIIPNHSMGMLRPTAYVEPDTLALRWSSDPVVLPNGEVVRMSRDPPAPRPGLRVAVAVTGSEDGQYYYRPSGAYEIRSDDTVVQVQETPCTRAPEGGIEEDFETWFERLREARAGVPLATQSPMSPQYLGIRCRTDD